VCYESTINPVRGVEEGHMRGRIENAVLNSRSLRIMLDYFALALF